MIKEEDTQQSVVSEHYRKQAETYGLSSLSTMPDEIIRSREQDAICRYMDVILKDNPSVRNVLEIGCGNGYLLSILGRRYPDLAFTGLDFSADMIRLARSRNLNGCLFMEGDIRSVALESDSFDLVVSERCIINCMDVTDQARALREVHRLLREGAHCILIEGFADGFDNMNRARIELGLKPLDMPYHNLFFDKSWFENIVEGLFRMKRPAEFGDASLPEFNFLSSHYFMSRVVNSCLTRREDLRNTEFVKFFSFLPPIGNYAPVQLFVLQKA